MAECLTPFKFEGQSSMLDAPILASQLSEMVGGSGVKISALVSASKNIKVNADNNISIKELIANKDRNTQQIA